MSNGFISGLREMNNVTYTENGAVSLRSTLDAVYDLFALGAAYRQRSEEDIISLFKKAYREDAELAMKCLFYIRDAREGQGERRFFRVCMNWLAKSDDREAAKRNLQHVAEFGRWDDLYCFIDTPLQNDALEIMRQQIALDMSCKTPSLLAKWLKSINTSSAESRRLANITREYFRMTHKQYRRTLSILRERINVLEKLMSAGEWDKIEFDKIPSRAGLIYRNAFAHRDVLRERYEKFIMDKNTKVNAKVLYPYECVKSALDYIEHENYGLGSDKLDRAAINKYWDNLKDYFNGASLNAMAIVDTSGSMTIKYNSIAPINIAISLGLYCAEKCSGPYKGHFITFESNPHFMEVKGEDFVEKVEYVSVAPWGGNTNIERAFDMMLEVAVRNNLSQEDIPENLIIISDQEFDAATWDHGFSTLCDAIKDNWAGMGYKMPHLIFWNCNARHDLIPMRDEGEVTFVSGASPVIFEMIMSSKSGKKMMKEKLGSERYSCIH